ncbi:MAG: nucleotide sugar dehydrogenase [Hyphomonadaceae bacterium]
MIGMGYVGLTLAVAMAEVGFRVHGVESNPDTVQAIRSGRAPFREVGLDQKVVQQVASGALSVSQEWPAPGVCNVYIVTVGTPLASGQKATNLDSIRVVTSRLASNLRPNNMVILRSTVRVGVSRSIVKPVLDETGFPYDLAFCPERTLEGKALQELRTLPQIIGGVNYASSARAAQLFNYLTPTTIRVSDLETAEMIKLINNSQRDLMFAFANEVAEICDAIGVSAPEVIEAGNMGYPRGGMPMPGPVGGPCLEKDPYILAEGVAGLGTNVRLSMLGREVNEALPRRAAEAMAEELSTRVAPDKVAKGVVMGVAFKGRPETSDLRGTLAIPLIAELRRLYPHARLVAYDPSVPDDDIRGLGVEPCASAEDAFRDAAFVIYQNNNPAFGRLDLSALSKLMQRDGVIYDMWNQYIDERSQLRSDITYFGLGTRLFAGQRPAASHAAANDA